MIIGIFIKNRSLLEDAGVRAMMQALEDAKAETYVLDSGVLDSKVSDSGSEIRKGTDVVLSVGGDGTFLSAAKCVADSGIPILGVNLGRLGFLSENRPEDVVEALQLKSYEIEDRTMLHAVLDGNRIAGSEDVWPYALNEITIHRSGAAMLGINVSIDGNALPTYWADGLLVATSSGSTAYSLSAGGPICTPDSKVLIISPIAPHNLNVRPLVVPETTAIHISLVSRDDSAVFTTDNRTMEISADTRMDVSMAQFSLKRIRLRKSSFVKALVSKLFWGEDIRNNGD